MHYKVIAKLNRMYSFILVPKLNIPQILKDKNVHKTTKKMAQIVSPMLFLHRLIEKAELKGINVKIVNENMTTQTCGKCLNTYKFSGETYNCAKCKLSIERDINSARNIYIKEIGKMIEFVRGIEKYC